MTIQQVLALVSAGQQLAMVGIATVDTIRTWVRSLQPGLSEDDLNAICDHISAGAKRHKALAGADAGGAGTGN